MREDLIVPYSRVGWYEDPTGYVVWRTGTGDNTELLHVHTDRAVKGRGCGRKLVYEMLDRLRDEPPYWSVFGFTRVSNDEARAFYAALGFNLHEVPGVYADGRAVLFEAPYAELVRRMEEYRGRPA